MSALWIKNAVIVSDGNQFRGSVVIDGDTIVEVLKDDQNPASPPHEIIDAQEAWLMPGAIDEHVHFREPGFTHKADILSESRAAVAGGVTSVMDMPNTNPQTVTLEAWQDKQDLFAEKSLVNYACYFGATNNNLKLFHQLDPHQVPGIKLFMGASTGNMLVDKADTLAQLFAETGLLIAAHCEDQNVIRTNTDIYLKRYRQANDDLPSAFHTLIRTEEACYRSTAAAIELAQKYGTRLHVLHLSTAKELTLFGSGAIADKRITAEVCVPHLVFTQQTWTKMGSNFTKCNPAVKSDMDRQALREAVADHTIDTIATDHAPHTIDEKTGGALRAASGMPSIQFAFPIAIAMFGPQIAVQKMCHAPAELYKIRNRGHIRVGYKADLAVIKQRTNTQHDMVPVLSKCGWTPYHEHPLSQVWMTFVNGHKVFDLHAETLIDNQPYGQALLFQ